MPELNEIIHQTVRLRIMAALVTLAKMRKWNLLIYVICWKLQMATWVHICEN